MPRYIAGKVPIPGSTSSSTFVTRRFNSRARMGFERKAKADAERFLAQMRTIQESRFRAIPEHQKLEGLVFRGRSGKRQLIKGTSTTIPATTKEVGGYKAYPGFGLLPSITAGAQYKLAGGYDKFNHKRQLVNIKELRSDLNRLIAIAGLPHIGARFVIWHVGRWALMEIVYATPFETGEAAAGWSISPQIRGKGKGYGRVGFRISNSVPYLIFLEHGHSKQAPQGMVRVTMLTAQVQLEKLMDALIAWWQNQQIRLRGWKYEPGIGGTLDLNEVERKIPNLSWKQLLSELKAVLPLDKPVAHLNAEAYLAMRIDDPKDWHTVSLDSGEHPEYPGGFKEPSHIFESMLVRRTVKTKLVNEFDIQSAGDVLRTERIKTSTEIVASHVRTAKADLRNQAAELERKWRTFK